MTRGTEGSWTPILAIGPDAWLGLHDDSLALGDRIAPKRDVDVTNPVGLLPCLERPYRDVVDDLTVREAELGLRPGELLGRVPLGALPRLAVDIRMDHWALRAVEWLPEITSREETERLLALIVDAEWASQHTRHVASRIRGNHSVS